MNEMINDKLSLSNSTFGVASRYAAAKSEAPASQHSINASRRNPAFSSGVAGRYAERVNLKKNNKQ